MSSFIFWCLKWLAILTIKYTKHPYGMFKLREVLLWMERTPHLFFEANAIDNSFSPLKYDLEGEFARKIMYRGESNVSELL